MKVCIISSFFTGATLPFIKHLCDNGNMCDFYHMVAQGKSKIENLTYDKAVYGDKLIRLSKKNSIYSYLNSSVNITLTPFYIVKNRKFLIGYIPYFRNLLIINKMINEIVSNQYDLIYIIVHEENDAIVAKKLKSKGINNIVIAYHEVVTNHTKNPELKKVVKETAILGYPLICYSKHTKQKLQELINNDNINVIYFGPFEVYKLVDTSKPIISEPYILFIGRILPYKGLSLLYETIKDYGKEFNTKIVVAGKGYDSCLGEMEKDNRFIVINKFITEQEFANLTRYASCVVCPYKAGSQSGITQTAMVYGTPVVATKVGAFPEFIEDGKNGSLIDYGDEKQLFNAIRKYIKENKKYCYVLEHLKWDNIVKEFVNLNFI